MKQTFKDHFSEKSSEYAAFRPTYPDELFRYLAGLTNEHELVWDCGTGSGQAAKSLVTYYDRVMATDASQAQISQALPHARIDYVVATAEQAGIKNNSVDLVTVSQALHWFDLNRFYPEVRRVLKPDGVFVAWTYFLFTSKNKQVDEIVWRIYHKIAHPYWPDERKHVEVGYRDLPFPFEEIQPPKFAMTCSWDLKGLIGYVNSWSATKKHFEATGKTPIQVVEKELERAWPNPDEKIIFHWDLSLRVGKCRF